MQSVLESWRKCWREGFAPTISTRGLLALKKGLERDDPALIQGATTSPPPLLCVSQEPVDGACAVAYCGWAGENLETVDEVEQYFGTTCARADKLLGEPGACRYFMNYFDEQPRAEVRRELLAEVNRELAQRWPSAAAA